jgi:hypothetical protein
MKKFLVILLACAACGGSTPPSVTVAPATPSATASVTTPAPKRALALVPLWEAKAPIGTGGIALDRGRLLFDVGGELHVANEHGAVAPGPPSARRVVVGTDIFDPSSFARHTPPLPKNLECDAMAFTLDATRMSLHCHDPKGDDAVYLYDARNGAELGRFDEFRSAAPVRTGSITDSGSFIFWSARASGAFEDIKSRVVGPPTSSISIMSPDESMLFTTPNKQWYTDDTTPAKILDPKNGHVIYELTNDVTSVTFAPRGGVFAVHHSSRWRDMDFEKPDIESITVHATATDFVNVDATSVVFGEDGRTLATISNVVRVFAIDR